jgi:hypothetical protein
MAFLLCLKIDLGKATIMDLSSRTYINYLRATSAGLFLGFFVCCVPVLYINARGGGSNYLTVCCSYICSACCSYMVCKAAKVRWCKLVGFSELWIREDGGVERLGYWEGLLNGLCFILFLVYCGLSYFFDIIEGRSQTLALDSPGLLFFGFFMLFLALYSRGGGGGPDVRRDLFFRIWVGCQEDSYSAWQSNYQPMFYDSLFDFNGASSINCLLICVVPPAANLFFIMRGGEVDFCGGSLIYWIGLFYWATFASFIVYVRGQEREVEMRGGYKFLPFASWWWFLSWIGVIAFMIYSRGWMGGGEGGGEGGEEWWVISFLDMVGIWLACETLFWYNEARKGLDLPQTDRLLNP